MITGLRDIMINFQIRYWHIDYPELVTWRDLYGQHDSTIIIGLDDNTNYWSSVQVMNYAGVGPIGEIRLAETFHLREYASRWGGGGGCNPFPNNKS